MPGDKVIDVPGVGTVSFPSDMSDDAIGSAIQTNMLKTGAGMEHPTAPYPEVKPWRPMAEPADMSKLPPVNAQPLPLPFSAAESGIVPALKAIGRGVVGSAIGAGGGGYIGKGLGPEGEKIGRTVGGIGGAILGGQDEIPGMPKMLRSPSSIEPEFTPINKSPNWTQMKQFYSPPKVNAPEPELGSPKNPGWMAKLPTRMPELPAKTPEVGTPENPGWMAKLPTRMPVARGGATSMPTMGQGEGPIGSGPTERYIQTLMQKPILTPEEQASAEKLLGSNARMRAGEGFTDWRSRVTGKLKAARPRTE